MKFIKLKNASGDKHMVNIDQIVHIEIDEDSYKYLNCPNPSMRRWKIMLTMSNGELYYIKTQLGETFNEALCRHGIEELF